MTVQDHLHAVRHRLCWRNQHIVGACILRVHVHMHTRGYICIPFVHTHTANTDHRTMHAGHSGRRRAGTRDRRAIGRSMSRIDGRRARSRRAWGRSRAGATQSTARRSIDRSIARAPVARQTPSVTDARWFRPSRVRVRGGGDDGDDGDDGGASGGADGDVRDRAGGERAEVWVGMSIDDGGDGRGRGRGTTTGGVRGGR
mmetsp:Transcript_7786/g.25780  ORF Transcript_7786/g.25780 Transcript_7786/m.25780 type:complete len:200 (-) Transcript_7786:243-842(-)